MQRLARSIVLYDTLFGSTEKVAKALSRGIQAKAGTVDCLNINKVHIEELRQYDFIAVGAPTQAFSASKPMKDFLQRMRADDLLGHRGFAFDTKLDSRFSGSAGKYIESKLREMGLEIVEPRKSAIVSGGTKQSTLKPGEEEAFEILGEKIGKILESREKSSEA